MRGAGEVLEGQGSWEEAWNSSAGGGVVWAGWVSVRLKRLSVFVIQVHLKPGNLRLGQVCVRVDLDQAPVLGVGQVLQLVGQVAGGGIGGGLLLAAFGFVKSKMASEG